MKYLPLIRAALARKPARAILTLLSVVVAFTIFGLSVGMNATFATIAETARADRIYVNPRFGGSLPVALEHQIASLPGVARVGAISALPGYHQKTNNNVFLMMVDKNVRRERPDWPLSSEQWDTLVKNRTGLVISKLQAARWHLNPGDNFVIISPNIAKADGTHSWKFTVLDVVEDRPDWTMGYMIGNADYLDKAKPLTDQGKAAWFEVLSNDPDLAPKVAKSIVASFSNSATPVQAITEKADRQANSSGIDMMALTRDVALAGLCMTLFLTANVIAQSVRERFTEFATLKAIGYSDFYVLMLVALEAAVPCAIGAILGVGIASGIARVIPHLFPPDFSLPTPTMTMMVFVWATAGAVAVAFCSAAIPALRLSRMDIATALSGR